MFYMENFNYERQTSPEVSSIPYSNPLITPACDVDPNVTKEDLFEALLAHCRASARQLEGIIA